MPSGYLHLHCAVESARRMELVITQKEAYLLGAQCPDPLFTLGIYPLRLSSKPKPYGKMLHTMRTGRFLMMLCQLAATRSEVEKAFTMGYLTHYALDSTVHPYVYAHSLDANGVYSSALHTRLEKSWDALYYSRTGRKGVPVSQPGLSESKACWEAVGALLSEAITKVYPENPLSDAEILRALSGAEKTNRLTYSPRGVIYCLVYVFERLLRKPFLLTSLFTPRKPPHEDIENNEHRPWAPLKTPDLVRNEGLTELFEAAVGRAGQLLQASLAFYSGAMGADSFATIIGNAGYDTGTESLP